MVKFISSFVSVDKKIKFLHWLSKQFGVVFRSGEYVWNFTYNSEKHFQANYQKDLGRRVVGTLLKDGVITVTTDKKSGRATTEVVVKMEYTSYSVSKEQRSKL